MAKKQELCEPQNLSVLIPYRDLEQLMEYARNFQKIEKEFDRLTKRVASLQGLYQDVLEQLNKVYEWL